ncbi:unnamed protein product [Caenorhabditis nigoni]
MTAFQSQRPHLGPLAQPLLDVFNKVLNIANDLEKVGTRPVTEDEHVYARYETLVRYYDKIIEAVDTLLD